MRHIAKHGKGIKEEALQAVRDGLRKIVNVVLSEPDPPPNPVKGYLSKRAKELKEEVNREGSD